MPDGRLERTREAYQEHDIKPTCLPRVFARMAEREDHERAERERREHSMK